MSKRDTKNNSCGLKTPGRLAFRERPSHCLAPLIMITCMFAHDHLITIASVSVYGYVAVSSSLLDGSKL